MNRSDFLSRVAALPLLAFFRPDEAAGQEAAAPEIIRFEVIRQYRQYDRPGGVPVISERTGHPVLRWKVDNADGLRIVRAVRGLDPHDAGRITTDVFSLNGYDREGEIEWPWPVSPIRGPSYKWSTRYGEVLIHDSNLERRAVPLFYMLVAWNAAGVSQRIVDRDVGLAQFSVSVHQENVGQKDIIWKRPWQNECGTAEWPR